VPYARSREKKSRNQEWHRAGPVPGIENHFGSRAEQPVHLCYTGIGSGSGNGTGTTSGWGSGLNGGFRSGPVPGCGSGSGLGSGCGPGMGGVIRYGCGACLSDCFMDVWDARSGAADQSRNKRNRTSSTICF
jgi:hypothetical protein